MIDIMKAIIGSLLHDIGKVIQRAGGVSGTHSRIGADYLKDVGFKDKNILDCVLCHHATEIRAAGDVSPYAYIAYIADNIAAANDRREASDEYAETGWDKKAPLQSIFNLLKGESKRHFYRPVTLNECEKINYPKTDAPEFNDYFYRGITDVLTENLRGFEPSRAYVNSLLELTEASLSFVPSSTDKSEVADISLYDHMKLTAAVAGCIAEYISSEDESDYKQILYKNADKFYNTKFAVLYSADISGIQNFIYTIHSAGALKSLRARSFYLELFIENLIDEILDSVELTRANLLYTGGGHFYMLLPNTQKVKSKIEEVMTRKNRWLLERFRADLYIADGYCECSANELQNKLKGSYENIFREVSRVISAKKMNRYKSTDILLLNNAHVDGTECAVCKAVGKENVTTEDGVKICDICAALIEMSGDILKQYDKDEDDVFFAVAESKSEKNVPVSEALYIKAYKKQELTEMLINTHNIIRFYGKNTFYTGKNLSTRLWVGDYCKEKELSKYAEYAKQSGGIGRIGVLRMDVDDLGKAFTSGFKDNDGKYNTLSRTATFSRHLSMFFKRSVNMLLQGRAVTIIYSGGDDMFLLGAWDDIIDTALAINDAFCKYTQGKLTLSAGIGLYPEKYPVHVMARETGDLEDIAKANGKNRVALFAREFCFGWDELKNKVVGEKISTLEAFFGTDREKGNSFLYKILAYLQSVDEEEKDEKAKISLARCAYMFSRAEPSADEPAQKQKFKEFSKNMYGWMTDENDRKQLKAAILLYVYSKREGKQDGSN